MTNTLHRHGTEDSFHDDYVIFAIPSKGLNDEGCVPKLKEFLHICIKHNPSNMGNAKRGGIAPEENLTPSAHWKRNITPNWDAIIDGIDKSRVTAAVFSTKEDAEACLKEIKEVNFGLSINMSTSVKNAKEAAHSCGIKRHSVEYSLGFNDPHKHLPNSRVLALSSMCGHGMVSANMSKKMIDMVREGRRTPEEAAATLTRFCPCGVFNTDRALRLLKGEE
jgi:hypothetical protein